MRFLLQTSLTVDHTLHPTCLEVKKKKKKKLYLPHPDHYFQIIWDSEQNFYSQIFHEQKIKIELSLSSLDDSSSQQKGNSISVSKESQVICPTDNLIILAN